MSKRTAFLSFERFASSLVESPFRSSNVDRIIASLDDPQEDLGDLVTPKVFFDVLFEIELADLNVVKKTILRVGWMEFGEKILLKEENYFASPFDQPAKNDLKVKLIELLRKLESKILDSFDDICAGSKSTDFYVQLEYAKGVIKLLDYIKTMENFLNISGLAEEVENQFLESIE